VPFVVPDPATFDMLTVPPVPEAVGAKLNAIKFGAAGCALEGVLIPRTYGVNTYFNLRELVKRLRPLQ
jgi:hypothetical protein